MSEQTERHDLHGHGLKATQPRLNILALFQTCSERHLSAEDVFRFLSEEHKDLGLTTVYRVLSQLESAGLLKRNSFQHERALYELNDGHHHDHMICIECGLVDEFEDSMIERRQHEIASMRGFRLIEHDLSIYGVCANCVANAPAAEVRSK